MSKPLCDICQTVHEKWQAHSFRVANPSATNTPTCNHCVTKDAEIARLRNQLREAQVRSGELSLLGKPKRDRAAYMRDYRKRAA